MARVSLVLVSHSDALAAGLVELAAAMAPDVHIAGAGGMDGGGLGTSFDLVDSAVEKALGASEGAGVVLLSDLGSATLTVDTVLEFADNPLQLRFAPGPLVEGAVAAAVVAQQGGDIDQVVAAVSEAATQWCDSATISEGDGEANITAGESEVSTEAVIADAAGLHARPAAMLANLVSSFDADVYVNGVGADSMIEIMGLGSRQGDRVTVTATGAQASQAVRAVADAINIGFD
ncbi:dihydroxyacetone kinase phosphoryl donor subunit DhaM [Actinomyces minihominis]|uniref:dihydroxyacetone kinase phosphoryl donor subunit DhaM n=1 Tax=Actinomyces minihominis TaxID=2002838 RepID=UPI000C06D154|nr:dihydroxyacetone kinase phosphoryl donor subunit DhaM [Actinomyces minihominis]